VTDCELVRNGNFSFLDNGAIGYTGSSPFLDGLVECDWQCAWGSPLLNLGSPANTVARMSLTNTTANGLEGEGIFIPLLAPLILNDTYTISFRYLTPAPMLSGFTWGFTDNPNGGTCTPTSRSTFTTPTDFQCPAALSPSATWVNYSQTFTVTTASGLEGLENIMFFPTTTPLNGGLRWLHIDDISLRPVACCPVLPALPEVANVSFPFASAISGLTVGANNITNQTFSVNGTWTISQNLTLSNCDIRMQPDAQILVTNNAVLTITNATHIHGCVKLWAFIFVSDGASFVMEGASIIEDAYVGVLLGQGAEYLIDNSYFNKNRTHILLADFWGNGITYGTITDSKFRCHNDAVNPTSTATLLSPQATQITHTCIDHRMQNGLIVGGASNGNLFDNANFGIRSSNMSLKSFNNTFNNMVHNPTINAISGTGIFASGGEEFIVTNHNAFDSGRFGVIALGQTGETRVDYNTFEDLGAGGVVIGSLSGVLAPDRDISVQYNTMESPMYTGVFCVGITDATVNISGNEISLGPDDPDELAVGIAVWDNMQHDGTSVLVSGNEIENATHGIWASNITANYDAEFTWNAWYVKYNNVSMRQTTNLFSTGILASNCNSVDIWENYVSGGSINGDYLRSGIRFGPGFQNHLTCNTTANIDDGILIDGASTPSVLLSNAMENNLRGLILNYGTLGDIGSSTYGSYNNTWVGSPINHTSTYYSDASSYVIYYLYDNPGGVHRPIVNAAGPSNPFWKFSTDPTDGLGTSHECSLGVGSQSLLDDSDTRNELKKVLADTSTANPYFAEMRWAGKLNVYQALLQKDSLMLGDSLLTAFYDSCQTANIGSLVRAKKVAALPMTMGPVGKMVPMPLETLQIYMDTLMNISTSGISEDVLRDVLVIAFEKHFDTATVADSLLLDLNLLLESAFPDSIIPVYRNRMGITSVQRSELEVIAEKCPYEYGTGVYMARAMLWQLGAMPYVYQHECEIAPPPASERRGEEVPEQPINAEESKQIILAYPNPTKGTLYVELILEDSDFAIIELFNTLGTRVYQQPLSDGKNTLSIVDVAHGIYHLSIRVNGEMRYSTKEVILR
jgi:hypothetical protein